MCALEGIIEDQSVYYSDACKVLHLPDEPFHHERTGVDIENWYSPGTQQLITASCSFVGR
jgi:hypothetical protein